MSVMHDSDSEFEDEANVEAPPENHQHDQPWISLGEEEWNPDWLDEYDDQPKLLFDADNGTKPVDFFYRYFLRTYLTPLQLKPICMLNNIVRGLVYSSSNSRFNMWRETNSDELKASLPSRLLWALSPNQLCPCIGKGIGCLEPQDLGVS